MNTVTSRAAIDRTVRSAAAPATVRRRRLATGDLKGWLFVAPFLVVFAFTFLAPIAYAGYLSVFREQAFFGTRSFVALGNYADVLTDGKFWDGARRVLVFVVAEVPLILGLALVAALAIDSGRLPGARFFRFVLFVPYGVPIVVAVLMWGYILGDRFGLAGDVNNLLGTAVDPLGETWILGSIANIVTWEYLGYNMLIFYAALRAVPQEIYEAAAIDGAGAIRIAWSIKIPALRGAIVVATIFSILGSFQLFVEPQILRGLAPNVVTTFYTPNMYAFQLSFAGQQINYAATVAIVMAGFTAAIAYVVQLRGTRERP